MHLTYRKALVLGLLLHAPLPVFAQPISATETEAKEDGDEIIVQATRSGRRVQDEPVRVEVLNREEIEEKILMRPGNIALALSETGGLRVQTTSPALGASNIRTQGMEGRYTQLLADGLPLYGGQASSLGLLQIPPTDLGQIEVIKGAASALYGPAALGGVINLVSRRPRSEAEAEVLANATSHGGQDLTAYIAGPISEAMGASVTGGYHRQSLQDLNEDGWADIARYNRWTVRPRLFWENDRGATAFITAGAMEEKRRGGTLANFTVPDGTPFEESQNTKRYDAGIVSSLPINDTIKGHFRASAMQQQHRHIFGSAVDNDTHTTVFTEGSVSGFQGSTSWVGGIAYQQETYRSRTLPVFNYKYQTTGIFGQLEQEFTPDFTLVGSARTDFHSRFGTQFSPRLSMLYRPGFWTIRLSGGQGFFAPTPFVEEIEAAGLSYLSPIMDLEAETAKNLSLDVGFKRGPIEANATLFGSNIQGAVALQELEGTSSNLGVQLINLPGITKTRGGELLLRYRWNALTVTGSYMYVDASEPNTNGIGRSAVPLTPKHSLGLVAMLEDDDKGRLGLEFYYTGRQTLDDDPYRTHSRPYLDIGIMGEVVIGKARVFLNAENILDKRLSRYSPTLRPSRAPDGSWTVDAWAPMDGFVLNGGVRFRFGG